MKTAILLIGELRTIEKTIIFIKNNIVDNLTKNSTIQIQVSDYTNFENFHEMNKRLGFNYPEHYVDFCLDNTLKVAEKCNFEFEMTDDKYPKYEPTQDVIKYFKNETCSALK
jgi:DNA polymerase III alpha subunit